MCTVCTHTYVQDVYVNVVYRSLNLCSLKGVTKSEDYEFLKLQLQLWSKMCKVLYNHRECAYVCSMPAVVCVCIAVIVEVCVCYKYIVCGLV